MNLLKSLKNDFIFSFKKDKKLKTEKKDHLKVISKLNDQNSKSLSFDLNNSINSTSTSTSPVILEDFEKNDFSLETIYLDDVPEKQNSSLKTETKKDGDDTENESFQIEIVQDGYKTDIRPDRVIENFDDNILEIFDEDTLEMTFLNLDSDSSADSGSRRLVTNNRKCIILDIIELYRSFLK